MQTAIEQLMIDLYEKGYLRGDGSKLNGLFEKYKEMEKQHIEISDEEINEFVSKKYAHHKFPGDYRLGVNKGMKLYREQLKKKQ